MLPNAAQSALLAAGGAGPQKAESRKLRSRQRALYKLPNSAAVRESRKPRSPKRERGFENGEKEADFVCTPKAPEL